MFGQVGAPEGAARAVPMALALRCVAMREAALMHREGLARSSPLLQSPLSSHFRYTTAPAAASNVVMMSQVVLSLPMLVGA